MTRSMAVVLGGLVMSFTGCASMQNTSQQEYVYAMARPCEGNGVQITYVSPDGKSWRGRWVGGAYTWPEFQQCVQEQMTLRPYPTWLRDNSR
jgi:hypothetical protein